METFTIEQIKNYLLSQDSMGDILYNLKAENIERANDRPKLIEELLEIRENWNKADFREAYEDEWDNFDELSLEEMHEQMESYIYHTYTYNIVCYKYFDFKFPPLASYLFS